MSRRNPGRRTALRVESLEDRLTPATFTVTTTADVVNASDGVLSLREAIQSANSAAGADTIHFNIPGSGVQTISPTTALPNITGPTTIDGYSQPGASPNTLAVGNDAVLLIEVNGTGVASGPGLRFSGGSNTVRGLVVNRFNGNGLHLTGSGGNVIEGNFIGTDASGSITLGNTVRGIDIRTANNLIGGLTPAARNVISGNGQHGVEFILSGASNNVVQGNYIGTDRTGTVDLGNTLTGVKGRDGASNNFIGGTSAAARNVISGNNQGVTFFDGANGNVVQGNYIGTDATGSTQIGNSFDGVLLLRSASNVIGGTDPAAGNLIAGNGGTGVQVNGVGATGNVVLGNFVLNNGSHGVLLLSASENTVGGTTDAHRNVVSGNAANGIQLAEGSTGVPHEKWTVFSGGFGYASARTRLGQRTPAMSAVGPGCRTLRCTRRCSPSPRRGWRNLRHEPAPS